MNKIMEEQLKNIYLEARDKGFKKSVWVPEVWMGVNGYNYNIFYKNIPYLLCDLQKWLREEYNIHVYAICNFYNSKELLGYVYSLDKFINGVHDGKDYDINQLNNLGKKKEFKTYRQALEGGLQKAIKLI